MIKFNIPIYLLHRPVIILFNNKKKSVCILLMFFSALMLNNCEHARLRLCRNATKFIPLSYIAELNSYLAKEDHIYNKKRGFLKLFNVTH